MQVLIFSSGATRSMFGYFHYKPAGKIMQYRRDLEDIEGVVGQLKNGWRKYSAVRPLLNSRPVAVRMNIRKHFPRFSSVYVPL